MRPAYGAEIAVTGPIIDVLISGRASHVAPVPARGLIDTGASAIFMNERIAFEAGLKNVGPATMKVPGDLTVGATAYAGRLQVPVLGYDRLVRVVAARHGQEGHDILLGRSFLSEFILIYNGPQNEFHFAHPPSMIGLEEDDYAT